MSRRNLISSLAAIVLISGLASPASPADTKVYGVIFGIVVDESGKIVSFRVEKVIDPRSGSTAAVNVAVPDSYVAAARKLAESKNYRPSLKDGKPAEFFTWFYFDRSQPARADVSL